MRERARSQVLDGYAARSHRRSEVMATARPEGTTFWPGVLSRRDAPLRSMRMVAAAPDLREYTCVRDQKQRLPSVREHAESSL